MKRMLWLSTVGSVLGILLLASVGGVRWQQTSGGGSPVTTLLLTNTAAYPAHASSNGDVLFTVGADGKIPAGRLNVAGTRIELNLRGIYGVAGATDSVIIRAKICTVSGCGSGTVVVLALTGAVLPGAAVTNQGWQTKVDCNVYTAGASGTLDCQGFSFFSLTALTAVQADDMVNTATVTVDTTVDEFITASSQWNNISASNTITLRNFNGKVFALGG